MPENSNQISSEQILKEISDALAKYYGVSICEANENQLYRAVSITVKGKLADMRSDFREKIKRQHPKRLYFMCMEFLIGPQLRKNVCDLGLYENYSKALQKAGCSFEQLCLSDCDPGLGNGGLGRLAACYMDALTEKGYSATGFSLCYEYGLFKQKIVDGMQVELPDRWLDEGEVWLVPRTDKSVSVRFGGNIKEVWEYGKMSVIHENYEEIQAVPYDMFVSGNGSEAVNILRLWRAKNNSRFNMDLFSRGQYAKAAEDSTNAETITKVLYPSDNHDEGKLLRFSQQYFLASASLQCIISDHLAAYGTLSDFTEKVAVHLNDTHPVLCIPELMRILMDIYSYSWEDAWDTVCHTFTYTNHTVLPEALETWSEELFKLRLPRIYSIVNEINRRFCADLWKAYPGDWERISEMSVISHRQVKMANLAIIGSSKVNGVSKLHSDILKDSVFHDLYKYSPEKFTNVTNGISFGRWLREANPELFSLIKELTGEKFDPENLARLNEYKNDASVKEALSKIKHHNKERLSNAISKAGGIKTDPSSVFDVQAKRIHEYKRQLLNVLQILRQYGRILDGDTDNMTPQTYIFSGKAAPSYYMAKEIISLIVKISEEIAKDKRTKDLLRVVFIEDYCVSSAQLLIPAAEISEQISLAGKEASGTGNMKFMLNGALTVGTLDGANIEISERIGTENMFIFGFDRNEAEDILRMGYNPAMIYSKNPTLRRIIDMISRGFCGTSFSDISNYFLGLQSRADPFLCFADFDSYCNTHDRALNTYRDSDKWNEMSLINIAGAGFFSACRSISEYADNIWNIKPLCGNAEKEKTR